jgi:hypothetical protein
MKNDYSTKVRGDEVTNKAIKLAFPPEKKRYNTIVVIYART